MIEFDLANDEFDRRNWVRLSLNLPRIFAVCVMALKSLCARLLECERTRHQSLPRQEEGRPKVGGETMLDKRLVRFGNLAKLDKADISLACDIWLQDLVTAPWATREAMKLAAHLMAYVRAANPTALYLREMETLLQLNREEINRAMSLMKLFGVLSAFSIEKDDVRACLHFSSLQSLRMLELRMRYLSLVAQQPTVRPAAAA
jgi:hypothetical protein